MPVIELVAPIRAPIERCFDLARSVDVHLAGARETGERAVAGVVRGLLGPGDEVTWRARHFGVWQRLTSKITQFERPHRFRDSMVRGAFARFDHDHLFAADGEVTIMRDRFDFTSPLGPLGRLADVLFLESYMRAFLIERNRVLREVAESDGWREFLSWT